MSIRDDLEVPPFMDPPRTYVCFLVLPCLPGLHCWNFARNIHSNAKAALNMVWNDSNFGWKLNKCGNAMSWTSIPRSVATTCSCEFETTPSCQVGLLSIGLSAFGSEFLEWPVARASHEVVDWARLGTRSRSLYRDSHRCDSSTIQLVESSKNRVTCSDM